MGYTYKICELIALVLKFFKMDPAETPVTKLNELLDAVQRGDIDDVKNIVNWFEQDEDRKRTLLPAVYAGARPCPTQDDLVIAACSHNQKSVLDYLLSETDILEYLTDSTQDITQVIAKRTEAVRHALRLGDFEMVEKLYNYWSGDLYWKGHKKDKFNNLGKILKDAENPAIVRDQQLLINFKSLVTLNDFQRELYSNLPEPLSHDAPAEDFARVLLTVLSIYDKYSDIKKVRIPDVNDEFEEILKSYFKDESSTYFRALAYIKYEVYFRKLDLNIALLLLEKMFFIRNHLKKRFNKSKAYFNNNKTLYQQYKTASSSYKDIECAIYHLIYRTSEDWRLYLPADRQLTVETHHLGIYNGIIGGLKTTYDLHKLYNGPVLYFEREYFKTCLGNLKDILEEYFVKPDKEDKEYKGKQIILDENYLTPMMYMSDHYSLKKIVTYIEALEQTTNADVIMIERVLQVIGEMLKNTTATAHISEMTKSFLQIAISTDTIKHLHDIREFLSHTDKGELSIRIDIENNHADMLRNVKDELVKIKEYIVSIFDLCESVLDKSLLQNGLDLLKNRTESMPDDAKQRLDAIYSRYKKHGKDLFSVSGQYFRDVWPAELSHQLLKEIPYLLQNRDEISSKQEQINNKINTIIVKILPKYIKNTELILECISRNNDRVDNFNKMLRETFPQNKETEETRKKKKNKDITELKHIPNTDDIYSRKDKLDSKVKQAKNNENDIEKIKKIKKIIDCIEDKSKDWTSIKATVEECVNNSSIFASISIENSLGETDIENLKSVLGEMNKVCSEHNQSTNNIEAFLSENVSFTEIKNLHSNTVGKVKSSTNSDEHKRGELIKCFIDRVKKLKKTLGFPQQIPLREHVQRYKRDPEFRCVLEMLLADIENIIDDNNYNSKKCNKLLEGVFLGHVLDHGNPFLEVIGDLIDCHELPRELLSKAKSYAEDQEALEALYALFQENVDFDTINNGMLANMNDKQKDLHSKFVKSQNWKSYMILLKKKSNMTSNKF